MQNIEQILMTSFSIQSMQQSNDPVKMMMAVCGIYAVKSIVSYTPTLLEKLRKHCKKRVEHHLDIPLGESSSKIIFERDFEHGSTERYELVDALIDYLCNLNSVKQLSRKEFFMFNSKKEFSVSNDIQGKLIDIQSNDNKITSVRFELYSPTKPLNYLREWCDEIHGKYVEQNQTKFLKYCCYFDQIHRPNLPGIAFTQTQFKTTKSLNNLFGSHITEAKKRLDLFTNHRDWYANKGIPYALGFLLYGAPGTGKTSFIKSVANDTGRHIMNIKLRNDTTTEQLYNMFYNPKINVAVGNGFSSITVPLNRRLYVLEDVDCLTDVVLSREFRKDSPDEKELTRDDPDYDKKMAKKIQQPHDTIQLSHLLNVLDGILEIDGRMIIMTTNYMDRIDTALKRPGRFDCCIEFKLCTANTIVEMIEHVFERKIDRCVDQYHELFTPAQVQEVLLRNLYAYDAIYVGFDQLMDDSHLKNEQPLVNKQWEKLDT